MNSIVYVSDFNDINLLRLSIQSVRFFDANIDIFVLTDKQPADANILRFLDDYKIKCLVVENIYRQHFNTIRSVKINKWPNIVFYRLLFPFIGELNQYGKILYVDTDTIFTKCFERIFDLKTRHLYGMFYWKKHCRTTKTLKRKLNAAYDYAISKNVQHIRFPYPYYNDGVIVFDNKKTIAASDKWKERIDEFDKIFDPAIFLHPEQMFLNMFFEFDEFCPTDWMANADKLSGKTIIVHYYSAKPKEKRRRSIRLLVDISNYNEELFKNLMLNRIERRSS